MIIPKVLEYYSGLPDELPEDEYRSWGWENFKVRIAESRGLKYLDDYTGPTYSGKRYQTSESMWRKIIAYRNWKQDKK